jgi:eukaryotic-like serine/threonine-protein kinase
MASQRELVEQLFEAALSLAPTERDAFLQENCGSDPELKRIVQDLLAEHALAGSFLQHLPLDFLHRPLMTTVSIADTASPVDGNGAPLFPTAAGRLKPGETLIDRFVIVRFIAKGGMGEVYEAEDRFLQGVPVALKTILRDIADDPASQKRFEREVLLAREVTHVNLCPIYDIFHCEQQGSHFLFLTMKLLPGENLAERLRTPIPIPTGEGVTILKQLAAGLAAIHAAGIIHRDIKPNNIMLDGSGADVRLWITDFGLARAHEAENTMPGKEVLAGTPGYIAPELVSGQPPSQATDLFAFGVVLHEIFTGQKPMVKADDSSMIVSPRLNASGLPSPFVQLVKGCLDLDPKRRCQSFEQALVLLQLKRRTRKLWTRRQFAGTAAAAVCALAGSAWLEREVIYDHWHPLPGKRFVALLNWPKTSDSQVAPMLTGALSAIKSGLARMEAFDRNLLVISPEDAHQEVSAATQLRDVSDPLGANLVLAASGLQGSRHFQLFLRLLDPLSHQPLREKQLTCGLAEITSLPGKAVQAAASLLDVSRYLRGNPRMEPETQSIASFTAFQTAESLMKQPNDTGLDAAIDKYKQAVQLDPHYAVAQARLALAFVRSYTLRHDSAALDHARGNCQVALTLAPRLVDSHLALASVLLQTGNTQGALDEFAKALALDPSNPNTLMWQAQIYTRLNRWTDAERTFQRVLKERPNFWCAYTELGLVLHSEGKLQASIKAYRAATVAAPRSPSALSNLGAEYLMVGEFAEATESFRKSMVLDPDSDQAAINTSLGLRCQSKYEEALLFALKSVELNPAADVNWLELADCYSSLSGRQREAKGAYLRAAEEAERHLRTDPADGPRWMLLALYQVKLGNPQDALALIKKAESLGADDTDSQLYKMRILELLGQREDALATFAVCYRKGATAFEIAPFPDIRSLRQDPRYFAIVQSKSAPAESTQLPEVETF